MQKKWLLGVFLGLMSSAFGQSALYQSVAPDGSVTFSDTPSVGSHPYDMMSGNVSGFTATEATALVTPADASALPASSAISPYTTLAITQPLDQTTFQNQTPISVLVAIQPMLKAGDKVKLMLDGVAVGAPQDSLRFTLTDLARGTHQLQVAIVNSDGATLKSSLSVTVFKQQATVLLPVGGRSG